MSNVKKEMTKNTWVIFGSLITLSTIIYQFIDVFFFSIAIKMTDKLATVISHNFPELNNFLQDSWDTQVI